MHNFKIQGTEVVVSENGSKFHQLNLNLYELEVSHIQQPYPAIHNLMAKENAVKPIKRLFTNAMNQASQNNRVLLHWHTTPTEEMGTSLAQEFLPRCHCSTLLPVAM